MISSPWLWGILTAAVVLSILYGAFKAFHKLEALKRQNERLTAEVADAIQMKKNFVSNVSHELKAPLASMQETTHLLLERIPGPLTDKQRRLLELNLQSGKRLAAMIGNLLDLSKLEAKIADFDMHEQDVRDVLQNVIIERSAEARDKSVRLVSDFDQNPLVVFGDSHRLGQLFSNLVENAIHFSPKDASIVITAWPQQDNVLVSVADSGPGILDEDKAKIFEAFHPETGRKTKSRGQGFGLGLAISRAIAEAHGGVISIKDNPGGGSVFSVLLPSPKSGLVSDRLNDLHFNVAEPR